MNLNSAVFDNVMAIDDRLKMLEAEVQNLDSAYGFTKKDQNPTQELPNYPVMQQ